MTGERFSGGRRTAAIVVVALLIGAAGVYAYRASGRESTDDAQIEGRITPVAARVGGAVLEVLVQGEPGSESGRRARAHRSA